MLKSLIAASAALALGGSATAAPIDVGFGQNVIVRGDAYAIRACGEAYGPKTDVCYNQDTTAEFFPFSRGIGITAERTRVVRVSCDVNHPLDTTRGQVAREFCGQAASGVLDPAPFLI